MPAAADERARPLEPGHLVAHRTLQRLGEGIVKSIDTAAMARHRGERFVQVDFGREGIWSVPVEELVLVWQPPSVSRTRNRKDWLAQKKKDARAQRKRAHIVATAAVANQKSRLEQHEASLTPWRDPEAAMAHMRAHKPRRVRKKPRKRQQEPEPEPELEEDEATRRASRVKAARERLVACRKALRDIQQSGGVHSSPTSVAQLKEVEAQCAAAESELSMALEETENAEAKVAPISPKAAAPKTLAELAYTVLKESKINLLDGFMQFDTNKDGVLSADELQSGFERLTQVRLPTPQVRRLVVELEGTDGDGQISYMEFCTFFNQLAYLQEEKQHRAKFQSLYRDGAWPEWDGMTDAAQDAALFFGYSIFNWPPGQAETAAAEEAEAEKLKEEEQQLALAEEEARLGRKPWRVKKKRDIDWQLGWNGLPSALLDPDTVISYEDWARLVGIDMEHSPKNSQLDQKRGAASLVDAEKPVTTPRTLRRRLGRMLRRLGLSTHLPPNDLRSLRRELLAEKKLANDHAKSKVQGVLRVTVQEGRHLKNPPSAAQHATIHPYVTIKHVKSSDGDHVRGGARKGQRAQANSGQEPGGRPVLQSSVAKEHSMMKGRHPQWNETLEGALEIEDETETLVVYVWHREITGDLLIGQSEVKLCDFIELAPPVSSSVEHWHPLSAVASISHGDAANVAKAKSNAQTSDDRTTTVVGRNDGEICLGFEFTAREISDEERIVVAVNSRRGKVHLAKGSRDPEDVCAIIKRDRGFGQKARTHVAQIDSHRLTQSIHKELTNWKLLEQQHEKQQQIAAHDSSMMAAAKAAAGSLSSCEYMEQQARVAEVDTNDPGFLAACTEFTVYVARLLEADRRLVQNAGGVDNILAEMYRLLSPIDLKAWQKRGMQNQVSRIDGNLASELHRTGAPRFGGSSMDGPGFLGGPDQPTWHKPPSEEDKKLSPAKRKAKTAQAAHEKAKEQEKERQKMVKKLQLERRARRVAAKQAKLLAKDTSKRKGAEEPKQIDANSDGEVFEEYAKDAMENLSVVLADVDGSAEDADNAVHVDASNGSDIDLRSALMTSTKRKQNIERRIAQRVKQQQEQVGKHRQAVSRSKAGSGLGHTREVSLSGHHLGETLMPIDAPSGISVAVSPPRRREARPTSGDGNASKQRDGSENALRQHHVGPFGPDRSEVHEEVSVGRSVSLPTIGANPEYWSTSTVELNRSVTNGGREATAERVDRHGPVAVRMSMPVSRRVNFAPATAASADNRAVRERDPPSIWDGKSLETLHGRNTTAERSRSPRTQAALRDQAAVATDARSARTPMVYEEQQQQRQSPSLMRLSPSQRRMKAKSWQQYSAKSASTDALRRSDR